MTDELRRVDWRFLLGRPRLGRVLTTGVDGELAAAVSLVAERAGPVAGDVDGVVAQGADPRPMGAAAPQVPAGGWLWAEVPGRRRLRPWLAGLRSAGMTDVRRYWLWPSAAAPTRIVPLDERPALELSLRRQLEGWPGGATLARAAARPAVLRWAARDVALVAGRTDGAARGLQSWLEANRDRFGLPPAEGRLSCLFLTPRFRASGSVIVLVTAGTSAAPRLVVKLPRSAGDDSSLAAEASGLRAAAGRGLDAEGAAPQLLTSERPEALGGWPTLVESALAGRALRPEVVRRRPGRAVAAVEPWVRRLARDADRRPAGERLDRLVARPLDAVATLGRTEQDLVDRTLDLCRPLEQAELPVVLEHGDLSHPNVLVGAGGRVGVVDWERAEPAGLPLHDLVFFLAYVAGARHRARTPEDQEAAVRAEEAATAEVLRAHAGELGVPTSLVAPLVVACWARATADAWARGGGDRDWLRGARVTRLWRRALATAEDEREGAACASST